MKIRSLAQRRVLVLLLAFVSSLSIWGKNARIETYDILIKNGKVFDGSSKNAIDADIAIRGDTIVKIARAIDGSAKNVIDARGLYVSPGFIDLHTHVDRNMYFPENRAVINYLKQGVTSVVVGQCGGSAWPIVEKAEDQIQRWTEGGIGPNAALLVGHGSVRQLVMGMENRAPTPQELEKMKSLVKEAMDQGAHGISTGLIYLPGRYSETNEVVELVKVVSPYNGIYHTHIRNERDRLLDAVQEAITISKRANVPAHISHFKVMGKDNWGRVREACALIEQAHAAGLTITADQYPYQFANGNPYRSPIPRSTWIGNSDIPRLSPSDIDSIFDHLRDSQLIDLYTKITPYTPVSEHHRQFLDALPRQRLVRLVSRSLVNTGDFVGPDNSRSRMLFVDRMKDPEEADKIRREVTDYIENLIGADRFVVGMCVEKSFEGKSIKQIAELKDISIADAAIQLELMGAKIIPLQMCEDDIEYIMKKDYVGTGSDGVAPFYGIGLTHIRSYSTFLHKIKKYALQRKAVSVPHVIRSQTSLSADIMHWQDRGWIREGYKADITIFDLKNIQINTSISNPHQFSEGVEYLLINGELVLDKGKWTGQLPGRILRPKTS
ncbi:MAG: amidohydrolase family protein [Candidatus Aminicenantes bacterium]|jgi:N-acyl-D-aspartate/D-glutamate deacylase